MTSLYQILNKQTTFPQPKLLFPPSLWGIETQAFSMMQKHHSCILRCCYNWVLPLSGCPHYLPLKGPLDKPGVIKISCLALTTPPDRITALEENCRVSFFWAFSPCLKSGHYSLGSGYSVTHLETERELSPARLMLPLTSHTHQKGLSSTTHHLGSRLTCGARPKNTKASSPHSKNPTCLQAGKDPVFFKP